MALIFLSPPNQNQKSTLGFCLSQRIHVFLRNNGPFYSCRKTSIPAQIIYCSKLPNYINRRASGLRLYPIPKLALLVPIGMKCSWFLRFDSLGIFMQMDLANKERGGVRWECSRRVNSKRYPCPLLTVLNDLRQWNSYNYLHQKCAFLSRSSIEKIKFRSLQVMLYWLLGTKRSDLLPPPLTIEQRRESGSDHGTTRIPCPCNQETSGDAWMGGVEIAKDEGLALLHA